MKMERMELTGVDRARYFVPTAICVYLAAVCLALICTSAFIDSLQNAVAVTAAGVFGLCLSAGLGALFWRAQRRDLQFHRWVTGADAAQNFDRVRAVALDSGWLIGRAEPGVRLDATTAASVLDSGERVTVRFRGQEVLAASICDPAVGFSLVGRRRCAQHLERVRAAVAAKSAVS